MGRELHHAGEVRQPAVAAAAAPALDGRRVPRAVEADRAPPAAVIIVAGVAAPPAPGVVAIAAVVLGFGATIGISSTVRRIVGARPWRCAAWVDTLALGGAFHGAVFLRLAQASDRMRAAAAECASIYES